MRFELSRNWLLELILVFVLALFVFGSLGCGSDVATLQPMEDRNTLYFNNGNAYFGFDSESGRFCFWNNKLSSVFCGGLVEYKWVVGARIEDLEPKIAFETSGGRGHNPPD